MILKVSYDPQVDAAYIYLVDEISGPTSTLSLDSSDIDGMINLDFDADNRLVGVEVIPASKLLPATLLDCAG